MSSFEDSFSYNAVDYGDSNHRVHVVSREHLELPALRGESRQLALRDGSASFGTTYGGRSDILECEIEASTKADRIAKVAQVVSDLLDSRSGELALIFGWRTARTYLSKLVSPVNADLFLAGATFRLVFAASHPWAIAASETNEVESISGDSTFNIAIGGEHPVNPSWTIKNTGAQTAGAVTLQNVTRGELFTFAGPLIAGEWLRMFKLAGVIERDNATGGSPWTNAISGASGPIPRINGGATNQIKVFGVASGTLLLDYFAEST